MVFDSYLDLYNRIKSCHLRECILNWSFHIIVFLFVIIIFGKLVYGRFHNFQIMIYWHHKNISFYWLYGILHVFANCVRAAWFVQATWITNCGSTTIVLQEEGNNNNHIIWKRIKICNPIVWWFENVILNGLAFIYYTKENWEKSW